MQKIHFVFVVLFVFSNFLLQLSSASSDQFSRFQKYADIGIDDALFEELETFLVPRQVDTPSHEDVSRFLLDQFQKIGWISEVDSFTEETPFGSKEFKNLIFTTPSPSPSRTSHFIVLAAHYDSKYFPPLENGREFIGALDSSVSCALLLHIAKTLTPHLQTQQKRGVGLKIVFFDGEEAFKDWTATDSLYGARHLAEKWDKLKAPNGKSMNKAIDVFVLLDLLGGGEEQIPSFFQNSQSYYDKLVKVEAFLRQNHLIRQKGSRPEELYFVDRFRPSMVDDDHRPFLQRGVKIVHAIPIPFPRGWHTYDDDRTAIHFETVVDFDKIFRLFVVDCLNLT